MSIEDLDTVDFMTIDKSGKVVLVISDHLEWDQNHLFMLREKVNLYLSFIKSGEMHDWYPETKGKKVRINVVCKYTLTKAALETFKKLSTMTKQAGFEISYEYST